MRDRLSHLPHEFLANQLRNDSELSGMLNAPVSIFDLKTGSATLTPARIQQIQSHIPGGANVPVFEVRP
jgi:hypothetical protein